MELLATFSALNSSHPQSIDDLNLPAYVNTKSIKKTTGINALSRITSLSHELVLCELYNLAKSHGLPSPDVLLVCTQTPSQAMPASSYLLASRFSELESVPKLDLPYGCTGYVDCIATAQRFSRTSEYVYIFSGDISSQIVDPSDHATSLVFGDALNLSIFSSCGTLLDIQPVTRSSHLFSKAIARAHDSFLYMDGMTVLNYVIHEATPLILGYLEAISSIVSLSGYSLVLHQANQFIVNLVNKKISHSFPQLQLHPFALESIGNSSSSTIPIALSHSFVLGELRNNAILCGFGVGMATSLCTISVSPSMMTDSISVC